MSEYIYTDRDGDRLTIEPCGERAGTACLTTTSGAHLPSADLPKIVAELYKAAGQQPPVILPRHSPETSWVTDDGQVRPLFVPGEAMTPESIRDLCSWYASAADLADAIAEQKRQEAEREQIEDLATLIYESGVIEDSISAAGQGETLARAILAAGYARTGGKA